jgi:hypothetical protein
MAVMYHVCVVPFINLGQSTISGGQLVSNFTPLKVIEPFEKWAYADPFIPKVISLVASIAQYLLLPSSLISKLLVHRLPDQQDTGPVVMFVLPDGRYSVVHVKTTGRTGAPKL